MNPPWKAQLQGLGIQIDSVLLLDAQMEAGAGSTWYQHTLVLQPFLFLDNRDLIHALVILRLTYSNTHGVSLLWKRYGHFSLFKMLQLVCWQELAGEIISHLFYRNSFRKPISFHASPFKMPMITFRTVCKLRAGHLRDRVLQYDHVPPLLSNPEKVFSGRRGW